MGISSCIYLRFSEVVNFKMSVVCDVYAELQIWYLQYFPYGKVTG